VDNLGQEQGRGDGVDAGAGDVEVDEVQFGGRVGLLNGDAQAVVVEVGRVLDDEDGEQGSVLEGFEVVAWASG
jgi:hypothetical protein